MILAGGRSSRSGRQHKSCRTVSGDARFWIDRQVDRLRDAGFAPIVVVTGYRPRRLRACLHRRVLFRHHFDAGRGPFSTLQRALRSLRGPVLAVQTDTVLPAIRDLHRLRRAIQGHDVAAASLVNRQGHGGHPLMLSEPWCQYLAHMSWRNPDARLDTQIRGLSPDQYVRLSRNAPMLFANINTRSAWHSAQLRARMLP